MTAPIALLVLIFVAIASQVQDRSTPGARFKDCSDCPDMIVIPSGSFQMGSLPDEWGRGNFDESPVLSVTVPSFALGKTELTQRQWRAVMGADPRHLYHRDCDDCPVDEVSWDEAQEFLRALSLKTGALYRFPTESEWEYACRASANTVYCGGNDVGPIAWIEGNSWDHSQEVAKKQPNGFGLYDMTGNVWEWTEDCYVRHYSDMPRDGRPQLRGEDGGECKQRAMRGGSWGTKPIYARATKRNSYYPPMVRSHYTGFRPARELNPQNVESVR